MHFIGSKTTQETVIFISVNHGIDKIFRSTYSIILYYL